MQKLRLQNKWNEQTNSFDRNSFELKETDGTISGKVSISSKKGDRWISKAIPFVAFKSKLDVDTTNALLYSKGEVFEADFNLAIDSFTDKKTNKEVQYFKIIINKAKSSDMDAHNKAKANGYQSDSMEDTDDTIPF